MDEYIATRITHEGLPLPKGWREEILKDPRGKEALQELDQRGINNPTHDYVDVLYQCPYCKKQRRHTYENFKEGKVNKPGYYNSNANYVNAFLLNFYFFLLIVNTNLKLLRIYKNGLTIAK